MAKKRKTLPKDFEELLSEGNMEKLIQVFDKCELEAYGGYSKKTALAFDECPHELAKWLIENGADINGEGKSEKTPLQTRSRSIFGNIKSLLDLGADANYIGTTKDTPLHLAAYGHNPKNTQVLISNGANINQLNTQGNSPLELALSTCRNIDIVNTLKLSQIYLELGVAINPKMQDDVKRIGKVFEFYRDSFNKDSIDESSDALEELYQLYEVVPVSKRKLHDGKTVIKLNSKSWEDQHQELWKLLVPGSGAAKTIQGEVIRISGRVTDELERNGGTNWDSDFNKMMSAFIEFVQTGEALSIDEIDELLEIKRKIKKDNVDTIRMGELAVIWVRKNLVPVELPKMKYSR